MDLKDEPAADDFDWEKHKDRALPEGQTLAKKFPHLEYASIPTEVNADEWTLELSGEIENPLTLDMQTLMGYPETRFTQDFHCITGWSLFDTVWTGVSGEALVNMVVPQDSVTTVLIQAQDEFSTCLWLEDFIKGALVYAYQDKPLSAKHGFPLRFIAPPHLWQFKSCKWVTGLAFLTKHQLGFWEIRAYSDSALVAENDRYANPLAQKGKSYGQVRRDILRAVESRAKS